MLRTAKILISWALVIFLSALVGCGKSQEPSAPTVSQEKLPQAELSPATAKPVGDTSQAEGLVKVSTLPPASGARRPRIAVIPKGTTHEFWKSIHAGALKAGKELNAEIIWKGPQKEDDREMQIQVVEDFISQRVDGIVLAPLDARALVPAVQEAKAAGIPVVIIDSGLEGSDYISFVATDNYKGGCLGAQRLAEVLGGTGKVILLRYQEGSASTMERERGFLETMQKDYPNISIISANQYGGATTESAYQVAENLLNSFTEVDGIFCPNESTTFGMLRALQDAGKAGKIKFVGFDSSEKLVQSMKADQIDGLVLQNPFKMGYLGVETMVKHLYNLPIETVIDTGVVVATPKNMEEPEIKELLLPDLSAWLGQS